MLSTLPASPRPSSEKLRDLKALAALRGGCCQIAPALSTIAPHLVLG
jgi:hypothetical protein